MVLFGPDLSHYQAGIDLRRVAGEGYQFVIAKVTQGEDGRDSEWPRYRDSARSSGLLLAGYHYITTGPPDAQAANCATWIGDKTIPVALDWEAGGGNWANFLTVLAAFRRAGLNVRLAYAPRWWWQQQGSPDMSACGLPLWSSRYPSTSAGAPSTLYKAVTATHWASYGGLPVALVQFTDKGQVAGLAVDCSAFAGTRDQLAQLLGITTGDDVDARQDALLTGIYHQMSGSPEVGKWPGWPSWVAGHTPATLLDYLRRNEEDMAELKAMVLELATRLPKS